MASMGRRAFWWTVGLSMHVACGRVDFDAVGKCQLGATQQPYAAGEGTTESPYLLCSERQLRAVAERPEDWGAAFVLGNDIDVTGRPGISIGQTEPFRGVFDGATYAIKGLRIEAAGDAGLFAWIREATVRNLALLDVEVTGQGGSVGALVGYSESKVILRDITVTGRIENSQLSSSTAGVVGTLDCTYFDGHQCTGLEVDSITAAVDVTSAASAGGAFGDVYYYPEDGSSLLPITNVHVSGTVRGVNTVGGIVGYAEHTLVENARIEASLFADVGAGGVYGSTTFVSTHVRGATMTGDVECSNGGCGGILGDSEGGATDVVVTGNVRCALDTCGGAAGVIGGRLERVVVRGNVSGRDVIGGLGGDLYGASVIDSFSTGEVTGRNVVGGLTGSSGYNGVTPIGVYRSYSTATVTGAASVGGLVGEVAAQATITDSFAAGNVTGQAAVSMLVGNASGMLSTARNYVAQDATCTIPNGMCAAAGTLVPARSWFFLRTNPPLDQWDFTNTWREVAGNTPELLALP